jgi:hypothetical protein
LLASRDKRLSKVNIIPHAHTRNPPPRFRPPAPLHPRSRAPPRLRWQLQLRRRRRQRQSGQPAGRHPHLLARRRHLHRGTVRLACRHHPRCDPLLHHRRFHPHLSLHEIQRLHRRHGHHHAQRHRRSLRRHQQPRRHRRLHHQRALHGHPHLLAARRQLHLCPIAYACRYDPQRGPLLHPRRHHPHHRLDRLRHPHRHHRQDHRRSLRRRSRRRGQRGRHRCVHHRRRAADGLRRPQHTRPDQSSRAADSRHLRLQPRPRQPAPN